MRQKQEPTYSLVILTLLLIIIDTVLAWASVTFFATGTSGVSPVYIAVAFMVLFALWFGLYGAIAAYAGSLLGGLLTTPELVQHPEIAVIWAAAGLVQTLIPLAATRMFDVDLSLPERRDWTIVILFAVLLNNLAGAAWGAFTLSLVTTAGITGIFLTWFAGNVIVTLLIVPLALRFGTGTIRSSKLFIANYWN
ncbi:hypothetical protein [Methanoregula sp. PtaB.Bin085]|uniref:hypothetical protein n=1 Tax=Methanoregula sp. PtaB.Bin085 TaxID=1811680 RepID=UPI0009D4C4C2|nr:hypothetical protein [Methanoregula sp. PtaB.Bin085]OPX63098.1 MAG: hypothetical protein A4E33_01781 [Methanoregula sp. PtaB.Bin085]